jgi:hypothetical protein
MRNVELPVASDAGPAGLGAIGVILQLLSHPHELISPVAPGSADPIDFSFSGEY